MQSFCEAVFLNGSVLTMDNEDQEFEAVAVCGNRISFVGTSEEARKRIGPDDTVYDLDGKTLLPGFNDAHCHAGFSGALKLQAWVGYPEVQSISGIKEVLAKWASKTQKNDWIAGRGWDESKYTGKRMPTRWDLDEVAPDHFVYVMRACGHMAVVNSKLLAAEGIDHNTPDPPGGLIERDTNGEPTGVLLGNAHLPLKTRLTPSIDLLEKGIGILNQDFMQNGITSVGDMSGRHVAEIQLFQKRLKQGDIQFRIYFCVRVSGSIVMGSDFIKTGLVTGFGNEWMRLGCFKAQLDGSEAAPSAAMWTPYPGKDDFTGILYMTQDELDKLVLQAHEAGYQVCVHAMGTRAIEMVLDSYERALNKIPRDDHRFRIEHCFFCEDSLADRIRDLGVIPILAPGWLYWMGDSYLSKFHNEWLDWVLAARRLIDHGINIAFHSDLPVIPCNPLPAIYSAVTRKTESNQEVGPSQKLSVKEALRTYTLGGAYASFEENIKGSIEVGKLADLVVLSDNILKADPSDIKDLRVELTMVDGQIRYQKEDL